MFDLPIQSGMDVISGMSIGKNSKIEKGDDDRPSFGKQ
jgi:hypothetical protein